MSLRGLRWCRWECLAGDEKKRGTSPFLEVFCLSASFFSFFFFSPSSPSYLQPCMSLSLSLSLTHTHTHILSNFTAQFFISFFSFFFSFFFFLFLFLFLILTKNCVVTLKFESNLKYSPLRLFLLSYLPSEQGVLLFSCYPLGSLSSFVFSGI